jgi:long-subunit fatty acid transport protein
VKDNKSGNGLFVDGSKARLDLPQVVRFGLGYQMSPGLRLSLGANAYLESSANFSMLNNPQFGIVSSQAYRNTYEEQAALEYKINPKWLWSVGFNFNQIGQRQASTIDISVPGAHNNYMSEGTGFQYQATRGMKLNLGLAHTAFMNQYENSDAGDQQIAAAYAAQGVQVSPTKRYNKEYFIVAIGVDYHF